MYFNARDFDYNIENLLEDYYKYIKESKSYKIENRADFVYAEHMKGTNENQWKNNEENSQGCENNNENNNESNNETSADNSMSAINEQEIELMRALYTEINAMLLPYVMDVLDSFEYSGSPMYADEGIDREFLSQLVDQVLRIAVEENDSPDEVFSENSEINVFTPWSRWMLMRAAAESIILNEVFGVRRPNRFFLIY